MSSSAGHEGDEIGCPADKSLLISGRDGPRAKCRRCRRGVGYALADDSRGGISAAKSKRNSHADRRKWRTSRHLSFPYLPPKRDRGHARLGNDRCVIIEINTRQRNHRASLACARHGSGLAALASDHLSATMPLKRNATALIGDERWRVDYRWRRVNDDLRPARWSVAESPETARRWPSRRRAVKEAIMSHEATVARAWVIIAQKRPSRCTSQSVEALTDAHWRRPITHWKS